MNSISLFRVLAVLFGVALAAPAAEAELKSVLHGAMDICQAMDGGTTTVEGGVEKCCAQEATEFDDGSMDFGDQYCVVCVQGTETCYSYEGTARTTTPRNVKKALAAKPKQAR